MVVPQSKTEQLGQSDTHAWKFVLRQPVFYHCGIGSFRAIGDCNRGIVKLAVLVQWPPQVGAAVSLPLVT